MPRLEGIYSVIITIYCMYMHMYNIVYIAKSCIIELSHNHAYFSIFSIVVYKMTCQL